MLEKKSIQKNIPFVLPVAVMAPPPSLQDNTADLDRLRRAITANLPDERPLDIPLRRVVPLCRRFRHSRFTGVALVNDLPDRWVLADFLSQCPQILPAMALDLGTTGLEATLIDLLTGQTMATATRENNQIEYGADILSRIHQATSIRRQMHTVAPDFTDPGLTTLQQSIVFCINELAATLAAAGGMDVEDICALSVSGNTAMTHLFLGLDPFYIIREPYIPLANWIEPLEAWEIGITIHPAAPVWIMPSIGSYFGGDLISGILATGLSTNPQTRMLIDVGTNAEVVIGNQDWLIACAGAAGPALEGGVTRMGMRAAPGAIEFVTIDPVSYAMEVRTIDDAPACGLCGSGIIDLVASLYLARVIDIRGKFQHCRPDEISDNPARTAFLHKHVVLRNGVWAFVVIPSTGAKSNDEVLLEQVDLDALLRSKAASYAVLATLINQVGINFSDLAEICVAGAFGNHINPRSAITIGMLPDLALSVYRAIGNSSLQGAEQVLLARSARQSCLDIVNKITYIELNVNHEFMIRFSGARFIPHTDPTLFPSVPLFIEHKDS